MCMIPEEAVVVCADQKMIASKFKLHNWYEIHYYY